MITLKRLPFVDTFTSVADFFGTDTKALAGFVTEDAI